MTKPNGPGPDLFLAGGECLTRHGVLVRRTDMDLEELAREQDDRASDATALNPFGLLLNYDTDRARTDWLNEVNLDPTRNLLTSTNMADPSQWSATSGLEDITSPSPGLFNITDPTITNSSNANLNGNPCPANSTITVSVRLKKKLAPAPSVTLQIVYDGNHGIVMDPFTGLFAIQEGTPDAVRVTDFGTEWLLEVVRTAAPTDFNWRIFPAFAPPGDISGTGTLTDTGTIQVRAPQAEVGTVATQFQVIPRDTQRRFPSLLLEPSTTNKLLHSAGMDQAAWNPLRATVVVNAARAPDDQQTAERLVEDSTVTSTHLLNQGYTSTISSDQSISVYAKAQERFWIRLMISAVATDADSARAFFNVRDGVVGTSSVTGVGVFRRARIEALPNGWFRCTLTGQAAADPTYKWQVNLAVADGGEVYSGDGASGLLLWGAQAEDKKVVSTYVSTSGATAVRLDDFFSAPFMAPPQEMTGYLKFIESGAQALAGNTRLFHIGAGDASSPRLFVQAGVPGVYQLVHGTISSETESGAAVGDLVELRCLLFANGGVQIAQTLNDGAEVAGVPTSGAVPLGTAWSERLLWLSSIGTSGGGHQRNLATKFQRGIRSLDFMRAL